MEAPVRVESKANVADAVSRGDLSRAQKEGWTRMDVHTESITNVLIKARPWTTSRTLSTEPAQVGGQRAPGGCTKCALPGASQFWGRNVGSRARSAEAPFRIQQDVLLKCPRFSACRHYHVPDYLCWCYSYCFYACCSYCSYVVHN